MFFRSKLLHATLLFDSNKLYFVSNGQDKQGLIYQDKYISSLPINTTEASIGESLIQLLNSFKGNHPSPEDLDDNLKTICINMGFKSWSDVVKNTNLVSVEANKNKKIILTPTKAKRSGKSTYFEHLPNSTQEVRWEPIFIGKAVHQLISCSCSAK